MTREPFIAHSELTNEIYVVVGKEKYCVTEQAIKAVKAIKALEQEPILDKIRAEIDELYSYVKSDKNIKTSFYMVRLEEIQREIDKYKAESEDDNE